MAKFRNTWRSVVAMVVGLFSGFGLGSKPSTPASTIEARVEKIRANAAPSSIKPTESDVSAAPLYGDPPKGPH